MQESMATQIQDPCHRGNTSSHSYLRLQCTPSVNTTLSDEACTCRPLKRGKPYARAERPGHRMVSRCAFENWEAHRRSCLHPSSQPCYSQKLLPSKRRLASLAENGESRGKDTVLGSAFVAFEDALLCTINNVHRDFERYQ